MSHEVRKCTFGHVRPAKIQISLRIRAVWPESSLGAVGTTKDAKFLYADNEDSDQTARMRRLIWVFVGRTYQKVRFLTLRNKRKQSFSHTALGLMMIWCFTPFQHYLSPSDTTEGWWRKALCNEAPYTRAEFRLRTNGIRTRTSWYEVGSATYTAIRTLHIGTDENTLQQMSHNMRKCTFWNMLPKKTWINICAVSLSTLSLAIKNAPRKTLIGLQMRKMIWIFAGRTCPNVMFQTLQLNSICDSESSFKDC